MPSLHDRTASGSASPVPCCYCTDCLNKVDNWEADCVVAAEVPCNYCTDRTVYLRVWLHNIEIAVGHWAGARSEQGY